MSCEIIQQGEENLQVFCIRVLKDPGDVEVNEATLSQMRQYMNQEITFGAYRYFRIALTDFHKIHPSLFSTLIMIKIQCVQQDIQLELEELTPQAYDFLHQISFDRLAKLTLKTETEPALS